MRTIATTQLSARPKQAGTASTSSTRGYAKQSQCLDAHPTSSSQSGSSTTSQLPTMIATTITSCKSSLPATITLRPATDETKSALSKSSAPAARTQQQDIKLSLGLFTFIIILAGTHSFLDMVSWLATLYLLAVTFIHPICSGYNGSLKLCGFQTFALTATVYALLRSVLDDPKCFYGAGILLYLIFGGRDDLLSPSSAAVQEVEGNVEVKDFNDVPLARRKLPELEDIDDVLKDMFRLPVVYAVDPTDSAESMLLYWGKPINGDQRPATDEHAPEAHLTLSLVKPQIDLAPIGVRVDMPLQDYTPVATIVSLPPCTPVTTTVISALSPINAITETVSTHQIVVFLNGHSPEDLISKQEQEHVTTSEAANAITLADSTSEHGQTEIAIEQPVGADTHVDCIAQSPILPSVGGSGVVIDGSMIAPAGRTTFAEDSIDKYPGMPLSSLVDTSSSDLSTRPTKSDSVGSTDTAPSSDGGIDLEACNMAGYRDSNEDGVITVVSVLRSKALVVVGPAELESLFRVHQSPAFYEGPLENVEQQLVNLRYQPGAVHSQYNKGETASDFTGLASRPDRPVSADMGDIHKMLEAVFHLLPPALQSYIASHGTHKLDKARDGLTGLNMFADQLELLWHQLFPPVNGLISITSLEIIRVHQMVKTRNHRPACPPGFHNVFATHRQYLTVMQEVKINQGSVQYTKAYPNPCKFGILRELEHSAAHSRAPVENPVLGWLDKNEGVDMYNAYAYLPCACGEKAMQIHIQARRAGEPGYEPRDSDGGALEPSLLGDDALEEDRQRKAREVAQCGSRANNPRSQTIYQECELHAIPTNKPWILLDGFDDANDVLVGNNELPVPGFTEITKYPRGFRMPQGFTDVASELLPPRCEHGQLHPPFGDYCMRCFPTGEHDGECTECNEHNAVPALMANPELVGQFELICKEKDQEQFDRVHEVDLWEFDCAMCEMEDTTTSFSYKYGVRWPDLEDV